MTEKPQRITLSRARGWRMPPNTVRVDRSSKFGNPFRSDRPSPEVLASGARTAAEAFALWLQSLGGLENVDVPRRRIILGSLHELRGKNLACWCKPGTPCHADVLLDLANREDDA